jgi:hypothetical protein
MNTKDLHIVSRLFQIVPVNQNLVKMVPEQAGSLKKNWSIVREKATNHVKLVTLVILVRLVLV